jgi:hypothetical protein
MDMGADYSFELISIETYAPHLLDIGIKSFLGSVTIVSKVNSSHLLHASGW